MSLDTFGELKNFVAVRVGASRQDLLRIDLYSEDALKKVWRRFQWAQRKRHIELYAKQTVDDLVVSVTKGSPDVVRVSGTAFADPDHVGAGFIQFGRPGYKVLSVTDADNLVLHRPWFEKSDTDAAAAFYWDVIELPTDVAELVEDEVLLLVDSSQPLDFIDEVEGRRLAAYPTSKGKPYWVTPGPRTEGTDSLYDVRSLRFGPQVFDDLYPIDVGYLCHYPPLPATDPERSAAKILIPEGRRSLVAWHALSVAYSEHPFTDGTQAERWEGKYERELDIALRAEKEAVTNVTYLEAFDR